MNEGVTVWLLTSLVGMVLAIVGIRESMLDRQALRELPKNGRWMIARHQMFRDVIRCAVFGAFVVAALTSVTGSRDWTIALLIAGNIGMLITTASERVTAAFLRNSARAHLVEENGE